MGSLLTTKIESWIGIMAVVFVAVSLSMLVFSKISELNDLVEMNRSELYKEEVLRLQLRD